MLDFEDILAAAGARRDEPCLVEVGRALQADGATTGYFWSSGRIAATVGQDWVRMKRRLGVMGVDIVVDLAGLRALNVACVDWARRRNDWARFFSYPGAPPPYSGIVTVYAYQPPGGKANDFVRIGTKTRGVLSGENLVGNDALVPLDHVIELANDVHIDAESWRLGERHGPAEGSLVGCRYRIGDGALTLDADRQYMKLTRRFDNVCLEAGEEAFVAAVLAVAEPT